MSRPTLRPRSAYRGWFQVQTRWADNDVYGHVNNVAYYGWFDTAVNAWLIDRGLLDPAGGNPIGLVVETGCAYAAPLSFPEQVEIGLSIGRLGRSSVEWQLGVFRAGDNEAAAQGHFVHVYVDRNSRRPMPLPEAWRDSLEELVVGLSP